MSDSRQLPLDLPIDESLSTYDFVFGAANREAATWIGRWPDWPSPWLCIHGARGCGKSHLANILAARADAGRLMANELGDPALRERLVRRRAWILEDVDRWLQPTLEIPLFHLLNVIGEGGSSLLLTAETAPGRWPVALPDLASRLRAALATIIGAPDEDLLVAVLAKQFSDRQLTVDRDTVSFMLARMERSFAAARRVVQEIDRTALSERHAVTIPLVSRVLARISHDT